MSTLAALRKSQQASTSTSVSATGAAQQEEEAASALFEVIPLPTPSSASSFSAGRKQQKQQEKEKDSNADFECPICLEDIVSFCSFPNCAHKCCEACSSLSRFDSCPICKRAQPTRPVKDYHFTGLMQAYKEVKASLVLLQQEQQHRYRCTVCHAECSSYSSQEQHRCNPAAVLKLRKEKESLQLLLTEAQKEISSLHSKLEAGEKHLEEALESNSDLQTQLLSLNSALDEMKRVRASSAATSNSAIVTTAVAPTAAAASSSSSSSSSTTASSAAPLHGRRQQPSHPAAAASSSPLSSSSVKSTLSPKNQIQLFARTLVFRNHTFVGDSFTLTANLTDTIKSIKEKIQDTQGFSVANQRLTCGSKLLDHDERSLSDYNIQNYSTLHVAPLQSACFDEDQEVTH